MSTPSIAERVAADMTTIDNPYWDAVRDHVDPAGSLWRTPSVGGIGRYRTAPGGRLDADRWAREAPNRRDYVKRYSWTITDPETVAFVAEHSRGRMVDPLAGTGYWGWLLAQCGVDVVCSDLNPPGPGLEANEWHRDAAVHSTVVRADGAVSAAVHFDRTLLLSWPPYAEPIGARVLAAYAGDRVIYIGEGESGCCGDDDMFAAFESDWVNVGERTPVQWDGMHDYVTVYDRRGASS